MQPQPQFSADELLQHLQGKFEQLCRDVADAVNLAPAGRVIDGSEEEVGQIVHVRAEPVQPDQEGRGVSSSEPWGVRRRYSSDEL